MRIIFLGGCVKLSCSYVRRNLNYDQNGFFVSRDDKPFCKRLFAYNYKLGSNLTHRRCKRAAVEVATP